MHRLTRLRASVGAVAGFWLLVLASPAGASVSLSWSKPQPVDPQAAGIALNRVSCPTTTQCTAVDGRGQEVTFNPQTPQNPTAVVIGSHTLSGLACPSSTQCTAIDITGQEVTFNPQTSAGGAPNKVDPSGIPLGLVCSSTTQCTAVDASGQAVTFNPQAPGSPTPQVIDANHILVSVDCPASSTTWCAAIDSGGGAVTFNPQSPSARSPVGVDGNSPAAVACPSTQCAVVDNGGDAATFNAQNGQPPQPQSSAPVDGAGSTAVALNALSCPSDKECVAVDSHGSEVVFDPQLPISPGPEKVDGNQVLGGVSCPAVTQCTAVDRNGDEVTFNPGSPGNPVPAPIDGHTNLSALSCPAANQCTTVDAGGTEATFAPGSSAAPNVDAIDSGGAGIFGVACPATYLCTAVDGHGQEVAFDPRSPGSPTPATIDRGHALYAVACTGTVCTAVDDIGRAVTFNPQSPGGASASFIDSGHALQAIACPSAHQCTAIDDRGGEVTFNPLAPGRPVVHTIDRVPDTALACPTTNQCTAVDGSGDEVTFSPASPGQGTALAIDAKSQLSAVACRTPTACVVLDAAGRALEGDPHGTEAWIPEQVSSNSLVDVHCPVPTQCIAVDQPGDAFLGASGPLPPVPSATAAPRLPGHALAENPVTERHGRWLFGPTSYTYQWERCNRSGRRCRVIRGATASSYTPRVADIGHRLRVRETAWNITGAGRPATSAAPRPVQAYLAFSQLSLTGVASGHPRLALTLKTIRGEPPLEQISLTLPGGFSLAGQSRQSAVSVRSGSRSISFTPATRGRTLILTLGKPVSRLSVVAAWPELGASGDLRRRSRSGRGRRMQLVISAALRGRDRTVETLAVSAR